MKKTKSIWTLMFIFILTVVMTSCGTKAPTWDTFEGALNEKTFPVPHEASSSDQITTNEAMEYVRYSLPGLKEEEGIPEPYLEAIKAWGWIEKKEEQLGSSRVFEKDELIVHLTIHDDYFIVMIPKEKKALTKGLKTK